ncbi:MAG TPA: peptide ABC transporter permease, partial [bacterium]|nr:peptide ABC transporter permease [bacterium]
MTSYFLRRLLAIVPTFIGITLVTFVVINLAPGGPIEQMLQQIRFGAAEGGGGGRPNVLTHQGVTEETLRELRHQFGFDKPLLVRYGLWLEHLARLDFGRSFTQDAPVMQVIAS